MPPMNPVQYAEQVVGVHLVYDSAQAAHKEYDSIISELDAAKDKRRSLDLEVDDREVQLIIDTRNTHPEWSKTAVNDHMKEAKNKDPELRRLKGELSTLNGQIAGLEADAKVQEYLLGVFTSRMNELGGYFAFLAACKNAETQANMSQQKPTQENA